MATAPSADCAAVNICGSLVRSQIVLVLLACTAVSSSKWTPSNTSTLQLTVAIIGSNVLSLGNVMHMLASQDLANVANTQYPE